MSKDNPEATTTQYLLGLHFILCHGAVDTLNKIFVDEKEVTFGKKSVVILPSGGGTVEVEGELQDVGVPFMDDDVFLNSPALFGEKEREGGITGNFGAYSGRSGQLVDPYLSQVIEDPIPAYRGVTSAILKAVNTGPNYYLKPWAFVCSRIDKLTGGAGQWQYSLRSPSSGNMNAVHIIRECLTNVEWGRGLPTTRLDDASFTAAAQTVYDEGLGFSFLWQRGEPVIDFIAEVAKHVQLSLYEDRKTGLYKIYLLREVIDTGTAPLVDNTIIQKVTSFSRGSLGSLPSTVVVEFDDNETFKKNSVSISSMSLQNRQATPLSVTTFYEGVVDRHTAYALAQRDLTQLSTMVYSLSFKGTTELEDYFIGMPFRFYDKTVIDRTLLMRVVSIDLGTPEKGAITIGAMEDFFSARNLSATVMPPSAWVNPLQLPRPTTASYIVEAPYYAIALVKGDTWAQEVSEVETYMSVVAGAPSGDSISAEVWASSGGGSYANIGNVDYTFFKILDFPLDRISTVIRFDIPPSYALLVEGSLIQIGAEILQVVSAVGTAITVIRGVLDTVPLKHTASDYILRLSTNSIPSFTPYFDGETVDFKLATKNTLGVLPLAEAGITSLTLEGRMHKPYPPANLKYNNTYWPTTLTKTALDIGGGVLQLPVSYATRNRLTQTAAPIGFYEGSLITEPNVLYSTEARLTEGGSLIDSVLNTSLTSIILVLTGMADRADITITSWSTRDGFSSDKVTHSFVLSPSLLIDELGNHITDEQGNRLLITV